MARFVEWEPNRDGRTRSTAVRTGSKKDRHLEQASKSYTGQSSTTESRELSTAGEHAAAIRERYLMIGGSRNTDIKAFLIKALESYPESLCPEILDHLLQQVQSSQDNNEGLLKATRTLKGDYDRKEQNLKKLRKLWGDYEFIPEKFTPPTLSFELLQLLRQLSDEFCQLNRPLVTLWSDGEEDGLLPKLMRQSHRTQQRRYITPNIVAKARYQIKDSLKTSELSSSGNSTKPHAESVNVGAEEVIRDILEPVHEEDQIWERSDDDGCHNGPPSPGGPQLSSRARSTSIEMPRSRPTDLSDHVDDASMALSNMDDYELGFDGAVDDPINIFEDKSELQHFDIDQTLGPSTRDSCSSYPNQPSIRREQKPASAENKRKRDEMDEPFVTTGRVIPRSQLGAATSLLPTPPPTRECSAHIISDDDTTDLLTRSSLVQRALGTLEEHEKVDDIALNTLFRRLHGRGSIWAADSLETEGFNTKDTSRTRRLHDIIRMKVRNQIVLIPYFNRTLSHWTLYVGQTLDPSRIFHYDSLSLPSGVVGSAAPSVVVDYFSRVVCAVANSQVGADTKVVTIKLQGPQQSNSVDCGIYVIAAAFQIASRLANGRRLFDPLEGPWDIPVLRREYSAQLCTSLHAAPPGFLAAAAHEVKNAPAMSYTELREQPMIRSFLYDLQQRKASLAYYGGTLRTLHNFNKAATVELAIVDRLYEEAREKAKRVKQGLLERHTLSLAHLSKDTSLPAFLTAVEAELRSVQTDIEHMKQNMREGESDQRVAAAASLILKIKANIVICHWCGQKFIAAKQRILKMETVIADFDNAAMRVMSEHEGALAMF